MAAARSVRSTIVMLVISNAPLELDLYNCIWSRLWFCM